jgi:two-component system, chemotaxis family, sensor kinase Cph1
MGIRRRLAIRVIDQGAAAMVSRTLLTPAFGQADLSNCEREQIHLAGSIQPHGALLVVNEPAHVIVQASANAAAFLGVTGELLDTPLDALAGDLSARIRPLLKDPLLTLPKAVRCHMGNPLAEYDGLLHRPAGGGLIIELERAGPAVDLSRHVGSALRTILATSSLKALCDETAQMFRDLTGYDRVMVYRFDEMGHGEVFSEQRRLDLEPYLGNRYPASDIPQIARRLYERNRVRVLADVQYTPIPLTPRLSPFTGHDLDMSLCFLRSSSPIHVQYLKNMGVAGTLVASLVVGGKLWGLVSCHHYVPRFVSFEVRAVCELLAEAVATRIAALESFAQAQAELSVRRLEQRMIEAISREGDWRVALFDSSQSLLQPLGATGAALLLDGQVLTAGEVPGTQQLREIGNWLDTRPRQSVVATASLGIEVPDFSPLTDVASGIVATPVSSSPGDYLVWFRPERVRTVTWGGNPFKPVLVGNTPEELSPRRSFSQWHQLVEGTAEPWTPADLTAARLIGDSVADVVLQFRSVRMLIAQDQLEQVSRQVRLSEQPVIITDSGGRILLTNESFEQLLQGPHPHLESIDDLPAFFSEPTEVRQRLQDLLRHRRTWRGEVGLRGDRRDVKPLLVRADPVFSSPDRVLGFVLLFTDLSERKAADAARRRFQEGIIEGRRFGTERLSSKADLVYQNLASSIVENAQLAALEVTEGVDLGRVPDLLDSIRASAARAAGLLKHLIWHATRSSRGGR